MNEEAQESLITIDIHHYIDLLKKNVFKILFMVALFAMIGISITMAWPDSYESETTILLRQRELIDDSDFARATQEIKPDIKARALATQLRSRKYVEAVLDELAEQKDPDRAWEDYAAARQKDRVTHLKFIKKVQDSSHLTLNVTPDGQGDILVNIGFSWDDPNRARDFVFYLREIWVTGLIEDHKSQVFNQFGRMNLQIEAKKKELGEAQQELAKFLQLHPDLPIGTAPHSGQATETYLQTEITRLETEVKRLEQRIGDYELQLAAEPEEIEEPVQERNPDYVQSSQRYLRVVQRIQAYRGRGFTDNHPKVVQAKNELRSALLDLEGLEEYVINEIKVVRNPEHQRLKSALREEVVNLQSAETALQSSREQLTEVREEIKNVPTLMRELEVLENEVELQRKLLNVKFEEREPILDRYESLVDITAYSGEGGGSAQLSAFQILGEPEADPDPEKPMAILVIIGAMVFGFSVGCVWLIAREFFKDTYVSSEEVRRALKLPVLGAIGPIMTELEVRRVRTQKILATAASLLFLIAFASVIYVCAYHPEVFPPELRNTVTSFTRDMG